jgi:hypothetical protein
LQTIAVYEEMLRSYRRRFLEIVAKVPDFVGVDSHTRFAALLYLPSNSSLQNELCVLCAENPLALHRLWKMHHDYSSTKRVEEAIRSHNDRVEWQLHRIYRARNDLVHAGQIPSYLDSLVMNAVEYYRSAIATIVNRAGRDGGNADIDQVVAEIGIEYGIYSRHFGNRRDTPMSADDLTHLV